jgi:hypothetical protein
LLRDQGVGFGLAPMPGWLYFQINLVGSSIAVAHTDGIYNPGANSVGDTQGIDSNAAVAAVAGLPLDGIATGIKSAYSTRKLLTAYAGSAIRVLRLR